MENQDCDNLYKAMIGRTQLFNQIDIYKNSMIKFKQYNKLINEIENGEHRTRQYKNNKAPQHLLDKKAGYAIDAAHAEMLVKRYSIELAKLNLEKLVLK